MGKITEPIVVEIAPNTYHINEFGIDNQYLLVGDERALVIDTGSGLYDMKKLIAKLTDKPYDVVVTHLHGDHNGGSNQFEEVWMHPLDIEWLPPVATTEQMRWKAMRMEEISREHREHDDGTGWPSYEEIFPYDTVDILEREKKCRYLELQDRQVFELGNRKVEVFHTPGHTRGSVSLLDYKRRILFSGDAMNFNVGTRSVGGPYSGVAVSTMLRGLLRIVEQRPYFDQTFTGHCNYANQINVISQPDDVLDDIIENLRRILQGTAVIIDRPSHLKPDLIMKTAMYGKAATIFNEDLLWEEGEEHIIP